MHFLVAKFFYQNIYIPGTSYLHTKTINVANTALDQILAGHKYFWEKARAREDVPIPKILE